MKATQPLIVALALGVATGAAPAAPVAIDMSAAFNIDAVGTAAEHDYSRLYYRFTNVWTGVARTGAVASTILDAMTGTWNIVGHNIAQYENNGRCFADQTFADWTTGTNKVGLPADYIVGDFELAKGVVPPPGYSRYGKTNWTATAWPDVTNTFPYPINNALRIYRGTNVVTLTPSHQAKYSSFNILFTEWRHPNPATYTARIEAKYLDAAWQTVWQDVAVIVSTNTPGGSFCTAGGDGTYNGTWEDTDGVDTNTFGNSPYARVMPVAACTNTRYCVNQGSPGNSGWAAFNRYLWTWDSDADTPGNQGITLDPNRVLEALRFTAMSSSTIYPNRLYIYAISAELVQEKTGGVMLLR
jgi:hypothetical protein